MPHPVPDHTIVLKPKLSRLDAANAASFRREAVPRLKDKTVCVVDLAGVGFVDSSGLGSLVSLLKAMRPGSQVRLANCAGTVRQLLQLTRLDRIFRTYDSVEAALGG